MYARWLLNLNRFEYAIEQIIITLRCKWCRCNNNNNNKKQCKIQCFTSFCANCLVPYFHWTKLIVYLVLWKTKKKLMNLLRLFAFSTAAILFMAKTTIIDCNSSKYSSTLPCMSPIILYAFSSGAFKTQPEMDIPMHT